MTIFIFENFVHVRTDYEHDTVVVVVVVVVVIVVVVVVVVVIQLLFIYVQVYQHKTRTISQLHKTVTQARKHRKQNTSFVLCKLCCIHLYIMYSRQYNVAV